MDTLKTIENLITSLKLLPSIGQKSAERMAYQILKFDPLQIDTLIDSLNDVKNNISICPTCGAYRENNICPLCNDHTNSHETLLIVSSFKDALALDKINSFHYAYHILNGIISPSKGLSSKDLNLSSLLEHINKIGFKECILALNPDVDGETTALYLERILSEKFPNLKLSRLAYGLPMGGNLSYADELTLSRALEGRKIVKE